MTEPTTPIARQPWWCFECGKSPAKLILKGRRICGVCWHQIEVLRDMSRKQRRDHHPVVGETHQGITLCASCGERLRYVEVVSYDRTLPVSQRRVSKGYWRHWRRS